MEALYFNKQRNIRVLMVFIQAILYGGKPPIADIFMAKQQPIFPMKTPFRVCVRLYVEAPISE